MKKHALALIGTALLALSMSSCSLLKSNNPLSELNAGYPEAAQTALQSVTNLSNPTDAVKNLSSQYGVVLSQLAGLAYDSPAYKKVAAFNNGFVQKAEHGSNAVQSLLQNFAMDLGTETQVFDTDKPSYGYPALPAANAPDSAYNTYRNALVSNLKRQVLSRLKLYHNRNFQNKFFNLSRNRHEVPALMKTASSTVSQYLNVLELLTQNDKVCSKQEGALAKALCFRQYLHLVANYPTALNTAAELLQGKKAQDVLTPSLTQSLLNPVTQFVGKYLK